MGGRYASVVLLHASLVHRDRVFTYSIPDAMDLHVGSLVRVPFARTWTQGIVTGFLDEPDVARTVPVSRALGPGLDEETVSFAKWVSEQYLSTFGEALAAAAPARVASEEPAATPIAGAGSSHADVTWARPYRGAQSMLRAIDRGNHAGFSLRPAPRHDRGEMIVSLVSHALEAERGALVLLPEVRFSSDAAQSLEQAFGDRVAWLGSDRSPRERYRAWLALRRGELQIACGGRAAVFAPSPKLGVVIVDDEGHVSYKERRAPRFHARTIAAERARRAGAPLVTIGTPPSIEVHAAVARGAFTIVAPSRADATASRPPVTVVQAEGLVPSSRTLGAAKRVLAKGQRVVFLAHRGGEHATEIARRVADALERPARLDARSTAAELSRATAKANVIVATPVIAKDTMLERVGLVVVCHADAALAGTEFRAAEEAFATWWHVARYAKAIVIETTQPQHPAVRALVRWDPDVLCRSEATRREELGYPPFGGLVRVAAPAARADEVVQGIEAALPDATILGPIVQEQMAVLAVRMKSRAKLVAGLASLVSEWRATDIDARVDVDPREVLGVRGPQA